MDQGLIIISPYPPKGSTYESKYSALASFAKNTVTAIQKASPETKILILADVIPDSQPWQERNLEIRRVWQRKNFLAYYHLTKEIVKESHFKTILIEFEWNLLGKNPLLLIPFPLLILGLRILKKRVLVVIHGVSLSFTALAPQLGIKKTSLKAKVFDQGLKAFYFAMIKTANQIIVLEQSFANLINEKFKTQKAIFIPHGVDTQIEPVNRERARKKLGIKPETFLMVNFGFLTWYKGTDLLAQSFLNYVRQKPKEKIELIFAGGESLTHKQDSIYRKFIANLKQTVQKTPKMKITGFLPEKEIANYFSAADLLVFPYRVFISSSGPLSLAFSFQKAVLLSSQLKDYFESEDMRQSLHQSGLKKSDLCLNFKPENLIKKLSLVQKNDHLAKLSYFSQLMRKKRSWENIGRRYYQIIFSQNKLPRALARGIIARNNI